MALTVSTARAVKHRYTHLLPTNAKAKFREVGERSKVTTSYEGVEPTFGLAQSDSSLFHLNQDTKLNVRMHDPL